jgi:hypothetical protein
MCVHVHLFLQSNSLARAYTGAETKREKDARRGRKRENEKKKKDPRAGLVICGFTKNP